MAMSSCAFGLRADINRDGRVNMLDLAILAEEWLMEADMSYPEQLLVTSESEFAGAYDWYVYAYSETFPAYRKGTTNHYIAWVETNWSLGITLPPVGLDGGSDIDDPTGEYAGFGLTATVTEVPKAVSTGYALQEGFAPSFRNSEDSWDW